MTLDSNFNNLISLTELAKLRHVSRQTIYNWLKRGTAPRHERIGGRYYFYRTETPPDRTPE
jgi:predicted DNA-binding transcriptional regulator AlpA